MGGDLGLIERGLMVKPFEDALFSMREDEVSDPIKTRYGFHVIKLTGLESEKGKELDEVRDEIIEEEKQRVAEGLFVDRAETFRNLVFEQPESLDAVVEELGLELRESDWFSLDSGAGIADSGLVRETAFSDDVYVENLNSEVIELDLNTLVALRKLESRPAAVKPLTDVQADIEESIRQEKARKKTVESGDQLLAELRDGADWDSIMADNQLTSGESVQTRLMSNPDTSLIVAKEIFRAEPPGSTPTYGSVTVADGSYVLYRLKEVQSGDAGAADEPTVEQIENSLARRRGVDYFASYQKGLRDSAKIEIFDENL
jgi:peptidyl-prolyl cis-trans isomerase D